jgi:peptide/nickel transport system permease protein
MSSRFGVVYPTLLRMFKKRTAKVGGGIIVAVLFFILVGPFLIPYSPTATNFVQNLPPSQTHPFGTDTQGHDVLSQVIYGAYPSMIVGIVAAIGAVALGTLVGIAAGYFRRLEPLLTGSADVVLTFPPLPLMVLLGSLYPATTALIILVLIVVLWPVSARSIRSQVLSIKERPYVESGRISGMSSGQILRKVIFPEIAPIAIAYFVLTVSAAIVLVTALQFLGVGNPDNVSWGSILYWAQQFAFYNGDWWWILAPGFMITIVALAFALLGFSIEEVMDPRLRAF